MTDHSPRRDNTSEPRGFGRHSRGLSGEYAHEQGWGLNMEQRKRQSMQPQNVDGDEPVHTQIDPAGEGPREDNEP